MPDNQKDILKNSIKEAVELLECIDIDENKLSQITTNLSQFIKENQNVKKAVEKISEQFNPNENHQDFDKFTRILADNNILKLVRKIFDDVKENPEVVENIEKKIFPILFSKTGTETPPKNSRIP